MDFAPWFAIFHGFANMAGLENVHHLSRCMSYWSLRIFQPRELLLKNLQRQWFLQNCHELTFFFFDKEKNTSSLEKKHGFWTGFGCVEAHLTFSFQMNKLLSNHCRGSSIGHLFFAKRRNALVRALTTLKAHTFVVGLEWGEFPNSNGLVWNCRRKN